jgi:hypothetical protein
MPAAQRNAGRFNPHHLWEFENTNLAGLYYGIAAVKKPVDSNDHYSRIYQAMSAL